MCWDLVEESKKKVRTVKFQLTKHRNHNKTNVSNFKFYKNKKFPKWAVTFKAPRIR